MFIIEFESESVDDDNERRWGSDDCSSEMKFGSRSDKGEDGPDEDGVEFLFVVENDLTEEATVATAADK